MANIVNIWNIAVLLMIIGCFARDGWALDDLYICAPAPRKCVCYDQVGCFSTVAPFNNSKSILPNSPSDVGVQGQLFTRRNRNNTHPVGFINTAWIKGSNFDASLPTKFVIHGFSNTNLTEWLYEMKDELLKKGDFNVFVISWGPGARFPAYDAAVANSRMTARMVTLLITNLVAEGLNPDDIHLIGHSLGAHLSGVAGAELKARNITLGRISGMDPAEPDFLNYGDGVRLSKDDAQFVDVIHTDGQKFSGLKGYGIDIPSGHVDFYINGGQSQPDCSKSNPLGNLFGLFGKGTDALAAAFSCSHSRSHEVFAESINSLCSFTAYPCESYEKFQAGECFSCGTTGCTRMGFPANRYTATGSFYLNTREDSPFCGHHYRVKVTLAKNTTRTTGQFMVKLNGTWGNSEWLNVTKSKSDRLLGGGILNRVVVAEQTVGYVQSISVKYATGSRGQRTLAVDTIEIEAGENGLIYLFCLKTTLTNKQVMEFQSTNSKSCPS